MGAGDKPMPRAAKSGMVREYLFERAFVQWERQALAQLRAEVAHLAAEVDRLTDENEQLRDLCAYHAQTAEHWAREATETFLELHGRVGITQDANLVPVPEDGGDSEEHF